MKRFLRRIWSRHSKLGRKRKKKQVWRKPTGRDNKMREKRRGYPAVVSKGYRKNKSTRDMIEKKYLKLIHNVKDLEKVSKNETPIIAKIGKRKKIEILKKAREKKIQIYKIDIEKFLKKIEKEEKK